MHFPHRELFEEHFLLIRRGLLSNSEARVNVPLLLIHRSNEVVSHGDWTQQVLLLSNESSWSRSQAFAQVPPTLWWLCGSSGASEPIHTVALKSVTFRQHHTGGLILTWSQTLCARVHFEFPFDRSVNASTISGFVTTYTSSRYVNKCSYPQSFGALPDALGAVSRSTEEALMRLPVLSLRLGGFEALLPNRVSKDQFGGGPGLSPYNIAPLEIKSTHIPSMHVIVASGSISQ